MLNCPVYHQTGVVNMQSASLLAFRLAFRLATTIPFVERMTVMPGLAQSRQPLWLAKACESCLVFFLVTECTDSPIQNCGGMVKYVETVCN